VVDKKNNFLSVPKQRLYLILKKTGNLVTCFPSVTTYLITLLAAEIV